MKTRPDVVTSRDGSYKDIPVEVVVCPECDGNLFAIYYIEGDPSQMHLQCLRCSTTFCGHGGECDKENMN